MPQQTHEVLLGTHTVTKVYRSWDRGEPDREWATLVLLAEEAPDLAPLPLDRTDVDGRPAVVMSRLPGEPLSGNLLTPEVSAAVGRALRTLHDVRPHAGWDVWPERTHGPAMLRASVAAGLARDVEAGGCRNPALLAKAVDAARAWLDAPACVDPGAAVLGLADGNLANVLWDGERCRLVDFEDSGTSTRAYELADAVEHVSFRRGGLGDGDALARAAGLGDGDRDSWRVARRLFACFWLMMLLPGGRAHDRNPAGSTEDQAAHVLRLLHGS